MSITVTPPTDGNSSSVKVPSSQGVVRSLPTTPAVQLTAGFATNTADITTSEPPQELSGNAKDSLHIHSLIAVATVMSGALAVLTAVFLFVWIRKSRGRLILGGVKKALIPKRKKWEFSRNQLKFVRELGIGFFGVVYEAQAYAIISPGVWTTVAVKLAKDFEDNNLQAAGHSSLYDEAKLLTDMGKCEHKNVARLLGICSLDGWHTRHHTCCSFRCKLTYSFCI
jgi:hypothetical protein